jgi:hypothetical protein
MPNRLTQRALPPRRKTPSSVPHSTLVHGSLYFFIALFGIVSALWVDVVKCDTNPRLPTSFIRMLHLPTAVHWNFVLALEKLHTCWLFFLPCSRSGRCSLPVFMYVRVTYSVELNTAKVIIYIHSMTVYYPKRITVKTYSYPKHDGLLSDRGLRAS